MLIRCCSKYLTGHSQFGGTFCFFCSFHPIPPPFQALSGANGRLVLLKADSRMGARVRIRQISAQKGKHFGNDSKMSSNKTDCKVDLSNISSASQMSTLVWARYEYWNISLESSENLCFWDSRTQCAEACFPLHGNKLISFCKGKIIWNSEF